MADIKPYDTAYEITENPVYDPVIRALKCSDPANAETIFNPLIKQIITNVHAVKLSSDGNAENSVPKSSYTATDILTKIKTVDGANSGLDADLLDGKQLSEIQNYNNLTNKPLSLPANGGNADTVDNKHASEFATAEQGTKAENALPKASYTANDILTKIKTIDGSNSGLDADTVDNKHAADFAPSGYGLGTACKTIEGDLNTIHKTGFYVGGSNLLNTPKDPFNSTGISPNCWYVLVMDNNDKWCTQIAVYLADSRYIYKK